MVSPARQLSPLSPFPLPTPHYDRHCFRSPLLTLLRHARLSANRVFNRFPSSFVRLLSDTRERTFLSSRRLTLLRGARRARAVVKSNEQPSESRSLRRYGSREPRCRRKSPRVSHTILTKRYARIYSAWASVYPKRTGAREYESAP